MAVSLGPKARAEHALRDHDKRGALMTVWEEQGNPYKIETTAKRNGSMRQAGATEATPQPTAADEAAALVAARTPVSSSAEALVFEMDDSSPQCRRGLGRGPSLAERGATCVQEKSVLEAWEKECAQEARATAAEEKAAAA